MHPEDRGVSGLPLDEETVAEIYREHGEALRRFVLRASHDPSSADDVVQETVLKVWRAAPAITGSLRGYLFKTARNVLIDNHRRASSRPQQVQGISELESMADATDRINDMLQRIVVEEALARLSPDHRAVVVSLHYERCSVYEAARLLGIPEGTVKSRAFYALRELRSIMSDMGVEP